MCIHSFNLHYNFRIQISIDEEAELKKGYKCAQGYKDGKGQGWIQNQDAWAFQPVQSPSSFQ